jgi:hypothetical protein
MDLLLLMRELLLLTGTRVPEFGTGVLTNFDVIPTRVPMWHIPSLLLQPL